MNEKKAMYGSQRHLQVLINDYPCKLNDAIFSKFPQLSKDDIIWKAPLKENDYAEPSGNSFWNIIKEVGEDKVDHGKITQFWPKRSPSWDALAIAQQNKIILIEAKAHRREVKSDNKAKAKKSISLIEKSIEKTKEWLKITCDNDWRKCYYQMSNRLAHLYFLKEVCKLDVYLVYVYFLGDTYFSDKVDTDKNWEMIINKEKEYLKISNNEILKDCFADVFFDIPQKESYLSVK